MRNSCYFTSSIKRIKHLDFLLTMIYGYHITLLKYFKLMETPLRVRGTLAEQETEGSAVHVIADIFMKENCISFSSKINRRIRARANRHHSYRTRFYILWKSNYFFRFQMLREKLAMTLRRHPRTTIYNMVLNGLRDWLPCQQRLDCTSSNLEIAGCGAKKEIH